MNKLTKKPSHESLFKSQYDSDIGHEVGFCKLCNSQYPNHEDNCIGILAKEAKLEIFFMEYDDDYPISIHEFTEDSEDLTEEMILNTVIDRVARRTGNHIDFEKGNRLQYPKSSKDSLRGTEIYVKVCADICIEAQPDKGYVEIQIDKHLREAYEKTMKEKKETLRTKYIPDVEVSMRRELCVIEDIRECFTDDAYEEAKKKIIAKYEAQKAKLLEEYDNLKHC